MTAKSAIGKLRVQAKRAASDTGIGRAVLAKRNRKALVERICQAGFVDLNWYTAATGRRFESESAAVSDYLSDYLSDPAMPLSPLLGAPPVSGVSRKSGVSRTADPAVDFEADPMILYLLRKNLRYMPVPVFDDEAYALTHPGAINHPGLARGHFLGSVSADTPLPVPSTWRGPIPTWGPWRSRMLRLGRAIQDRSSLLEPKSGGSAAAVTGAVSAAGAAAAVGSGSAAVGAAVTGSAAVGSGSAAVGAAVTGSAAAAELPVAAPAQAQPIIDLADRLIDWEVLAAGLVDRVGSRVSVLIPAINDWKLADACLSALRAHRGSHNLEVVIVDNGSAVEFAVGLAQSVAGHDPAGEWVKVIWSPINLNFSLGTNLAFAHSTGASVVLLNNDTRVCRGWLDPLLAELADPQVVGVQPLLLYPDGTIQTAGTSYPNCGGLPSHLLVAHPAEVARRLGRFDVSTVTAAAVAMRAADYCRLRGLDPGFINGYEDVDLCLRALRWPGSRFRVATDSTVIHYESQTRARTVVESNRELLWRRWRDELPVPDTRELLGSAGFEVLRWDPGLVNRAGLGRIPQPVIFPKETAVVAGPAAGMRRLRWALKIPVDFTVEVVPDGSRCWVLADRLVAVLRQLGQDVVIDYRQAHQRTTSGLDDVVLVFADSRQPFEPHPGRVNLLWIWDPLPDAGSLETRGFDYVFNSPAPGEGSDLGGAGTTRAAPSAGSAPSVTHAISVGEHQGWLELAQDFIQAAYKWNAEQLA